MKNKKIFNELAKEQFPEFWNLEKINPDTKLKGDVQKFKKFSKSDRCI